MVIVPTQKTQQVKVQAATPVFQSTDVPSGAFDSGASGLIQAGKDISSTADQAGAFALQIQQDDNEAEAKDADNRIAQQIREFMWGNPEDDQSIGYYGTERKAAVDGYAPAEDVLRQNIQDVVDGSSGEAVRRQVEAMGNVRLNRELDKMTLHAAQQRKIYFDEVDASRVAQANSDATVAWGDDGVLKRSLGVSKQSAADYAQRHSLSKEEAKFRLVMQDSVIIKGAFDAAIVAEDLSRAAAILDEYGSKTVDGKMVQGRIEGEVQSAMEKSLRDDGMAAMAQTVVTEARAEAPGDLEKQYEIIDKKLKGKAQNAAFAELDKLTSRTRQAGADKRSVEAEKRAIKSAARADASHKNTLDNQAEAKALKDASKAWGNFVYDEEAKTLRDVRQFRKENEAAFNVLSESGKIERMQVEARRVEEGNRYANVSKDGLLHALRTMDTVQLAEVDITTVQRYLTRGDAEKASNLIAGAKGKIAARAENQAIYNTGEAILRDFAPKWLNVGKAKQTKLQERQFQATITEMNAFIKDFTDQNKVPTREEITNEAVRLMMKTTSDPDGGSFFGLVGDEKNNPFEGLAAQAREMSPQQRANTTVDFDIIPLTVLDRLKTAAKAYGVNKVGRVLMEELAGAWAMKDGERLDKLLDDASKVTE